MVLPDILEMHEASAEARLDEMTDGLPPGKFRCDCGEVTDFADASPSGPSPYAAPMCGKCDERMRDG